MKTLLSVSILIAALLLGGCTNPDVTIRILDQQGYTNIQTHGYSWFACSRGDTYATSFTATNQNGRQIKGTVCKGILKGATIRFE